MNVANQDTQVNLRMIDLILAKWDCDPDYAIEILQDLQEQERHLPEEMLRHVADRLDVPIARLYHIGSFFKAFSFEPRGKYVVQVCMGTACHVKGAPRVLDALARELAVPVGATTGDGKFTLEPVRCLGCCALAPVVQVNEELHGEISAARVGRLLKKYAED